MWVSHIRLMLDTLNKASIRADPDLTYRFDASVLLT